MEVISWMNTKILLMPNARNPRIFIMKKPLEEEEPDVIVNPSNETLDLNRGKVSKALLDRAGSKLQQDCKTMYPNGIKRGEIAETPGCGKVFCKAIYHTAMKQWDDSNGEKFLRDYVIKILKKASDAGMLSVGFPALGTGALGYDYDTVAYCMFDAVNQFGADNPQTSITEVIFVIHPTDKKGIKAFEAEDQLRKKLPAKQ